MAALLPMGLMAQTEPQGYTVRYDTVRIDVRGVCAPVTRFTLDAATEYGGKIYCLFREKKMYGYGWDTMYICVIDKQTHRVQWEKYKGHAYRDMQFDITGSGVLFHSRYDSLSATFDGTHWTYAPWHEDSHSAKVLLDDGRYRVTSLDIGEWGWYTWIEDKPARRSYLFQDCFSSAMIRDGRILLANEHRVSWADEETLDKADTGFCSYEDYRQKGFNWFVAQTNVPPDKQFDNREDAVEWYKARAAKLYSGELPMLFEVKGHKDEYGWVTLYDTTIYAMLMMDAKVHLVTQMKGRIALSAIEHGSLRRVAKLMDAPERGCSVSHGLEDKALLYYAADANSYGLLEAAPGGIVVTTLIHNQDSLPWLEDDGFEKTFRLLLDSLGTLTHEAIDRHEISLHGTTDMVVWDTSRNAYFPEGIGSYLSIYYKTLADGTRLMSEYMIDTTEHLRAAFWDWSPCVAYNPSPSRYNPQEDGIFIQKADSIEKILTRLLGTPKLVEKHQEWHCKGRTVELYGKSRRSNVRLVIY